MARKTIYGCADPVQEDIYQMPPQTIYERGIETLPSNLGEALEAMKNGSIVQEVLGEPLMEDFIKIKEADWMDFNRHVSDFEIQEMKRFGV